MGVRPWVKWHAALLHIREKKKKPSWCIKVNKGPSVSSLSCIFDKVSSIKKKCVEISKHKLSLIH
jgi:hypothetical protein